MGSSQKKCLKIKFLLYDTSQQVNLSLICFSNNFLGSNCKEKIPRKSFTYGQKVGFVDYSKNARFCSFFNFYLSISSIRNRKKILIIEFFLGCWMQKSVKNLLQKLKMRILGSVFF